MESGTGFSPLYSSACSRRKHTFKCATEKRNGASSINYFPTLTECAKLSKIIIERVDHCTAFDALGLSTQIMVLDIHSPLSVAFVAAQETRLGSGVIWNPIKRKFVDILTSSDHIKILLYCHFHPQETEEVSFWTIGDWLSIRSDPQLLSPGNSSDSPFSIPQEPEEGDNTQNNPVASIHSGFVCCTTKTSLKECLQLMRKHNVHRLPVMSESESPSGSVVAMIDVKQILSYLLLGKSAVDLVRAGGAAGIRICEDQMELGGGNVLGEYHSWSDDSNDPDTGLLFLLKNNGSLPRLVSSIVSSGNHRSERSRGPKIGPYSSIFDVPYRCLPMIGIHRFRPLFVTAENTIAEALQILLNENIESIAVCTTDRIVTGVIRRSDLLLMEQEGFYNTNITVREAICSKQMCTPCVFHEADSIWDIFFHFVQNQVRELFMVDPLCGKLLGQLNIVEFVHFLVFPSSN